MTSPTLGHAIYGGAPVTINLSDLIGTDVCAVAKKGFGKSGLLRVLFEQTRGLIQQIILDPEDEFYTLREAGDYLIAGGDDGDCPAEIANARALAKTLMENSGISAVIQLGHLEADDQEQFVALFLTEVMATKREHWHPVMICLDETQRFAPQDQRVASSDVVKDMVRRGRKRGITPVFASLSHSSINKDVTRGVSTWLFGRVGTDIDRKLVANSLALAPSSEEARGLPFLEQRQFWAFGHPISDRPVLFRVADAQTTILKSGAAAAAMPPPPKSLEKLLAALASAAKPAKPLDNHGGTGDGVVVHPSEDTKAAIRREAYQDGYEKGHVDGYEKGVSEGYDRGFRQCAETAIERMEDLIEQIRPLPQNDISPPAYDLSAEEISEAKAKFGTAGGGEIIPPTSPKPVRQARGAQEPQDDGGAADGAVEVTEALQRVLDAVRWWRDAGRKQVRRNLACIMAGYSPKASTFGVYVSKLTKAGLLIVPEAGMLALTPEGLQRSRRSIKGTLIEAARALLEPKPAEIYDVLVQIGPGGIDRGELADRVGLSRSSSTLGVYLSKISKFEFTHNPAPGRVAIAAWLFDR